MQGGGWLGVQLCECNSGYCRNLHVKEQVLIDKAQQFCHSSYGGPVNCNAHYSFCLPVRGELLIRSLKIEKNGNTRTPNYNFGRGIHSVQLQFS